jgi:flavin-dependent dehydrogenase
MSTISPKTEKIFTSIASPAAQTLGAGGTSTLDGLKRLDAGWSALKNGSWKKTPMKIVEDKSENVCLFGSNKPEFDVVVCGGTLGVFYAAALQKMGKKVCIVERGKIAGRPQEWNISKKELNTLIRLGILDESEIKDITAIEFNPVRVGFKTDTTDPGNGYEVYVNDILNLGVKPDALIKLMRSKFIAMGGTVFEQTALSGVEVYQDCAVLSVAEEGGKSKAITAAVVMDSMGNASPISRQVRGAVEPDGICIVVGSCARGFDPKNNTYSDVIFTDTPLTDKNTSKLQYFWEAFPAGSDTADRTTYLFTYMDAKPERPSVAEIFDDYWELLPRYQGIDVDDLEFQRILYGVFPTYRSSPIQSPFHRILAVGDASGIQSPLSFGGFGSLTRHMERVCNGLDEALQLGMLSAEDLSLINPYQPNLSACWMFQRAMSVPIPRVKPPPDQVVRIMYACVETI